MWLMASDDRARELRAALPDAPAHVLDQPQANDLELLLTGVYVPLTGYLRAADLAAVESRMTLADGTPWAVPVVLRTDVEAAQGDLVGLRDAEGVLRAALTVEEAAGGRLAGPVEGLSPASYGDFADLRRTPEEVRAALGDAAPAVTVARRPLYRRDLDELRHGEWMLVTAPGPDLDLDVLARAHRAALRETERPRIHVLLPLPELPPGPRRDLSDALLARTFGGTVRQLADHPADAEVRRLLRAGAPVPADLSPTAVTAVLAGAIPPRSRQGFTVLFTGLSGSGKSTIAALVAAQLRELDTRPVTLLDGDLLRRHLTAGLGFSKQDRDTNVLRIGWVAAQLTRHGGAVLAAPIAPYDAVRKDVRSMVERYGPLVLIHVSTPLEVCEARDRKGLYARARAGRLTGFTGIDDPYEVPGDAQVTLDTSDLTLAECARRVLRHVAAEGLIAVEP